MKGEISCLMRLKMERGPKSEVHGGALEGVARSDEAEGHPCDDKERLFEGEHLTGYYTRSLYYRTPCQDFLNSAACGRQACVLY